MGTGVLLTDKFFGSWYYVEGEAEVVSLPEAMEPLVDYYRRAAGEHDDWDDYRAGLVREQRVLIRISRAAGWSGSHGLSRRGGGEG